MKKSSFRIAGMLALAFVATVQIARAQEAMVANIPFAFTAGDKTLPAGEYRVEKAANGSLTLMIRSTDGKEGMFVSSLPAVTSKPQTQSKLIFHRYGHQYFLSQVWVAGYSQGRQLHESAKEKEQTLAARNVTPDKVIIVARLNSHQTVTGTRP